MFKKLFNNPRGARIAIVVFVILLLWFFARESSAETTVEIGPTFLGSTLSDSVDLILSEKWDDKWRIGLGVIGAQNYYDTHVHKYDRPIKGLESTWRTVHNHKFNINNNIFVYGQRIVKGYGKLDKVYLGLGAAYFNTTSKVVGSRFNFALSIEYVYPRVDYWPDYYVLRHFSNAGSESPNPGQNALNVGWSFE